MNILRLFATLALAAPGLAQSDDCANAVPIAGTGFFPFTVEGATGVDTIQTCSGGTVSIRNDTWFEWTPAESGDYLLRICNAGFNVKMSLQDACGGVELTCYSPIGCTPDVESTDLRPNGLSAGTSYRIRVGQGAASTGSGVLHVTRVLPPANDDCANATTIPAGVGSSFYDLFLASPSVMSSCASGDPRADVWYEWTSGPASSYFLRITNASAQSGLAIYDACGGTELACADNQGTAGAFTVQGLSPNTPYLIQVTGDVVNGASGELRIDYFATPIGTNYCMATSNSTGVAAQIRATGLETVSAEVLTLSAIGVPPTTSGLFYFGTGASSFPFGDGFRCVGGTIQRLPIQVAGFAGNMTQANVFAIETPSVPIAPGSLYFQCWFRDTSPGMSGFNLSDGLEITFTP